MRFVPSWLHCRLLRFAWYRRKCGIKPMSPLMAAVTREALQLVSDSVLFSNEALRIVEETHKLSDWAELPKTVVRVRRPIQYTVRGKG